MDPVKTNLKRYPVLTISKKTYNYDDAGRIMSEETAVEFNDCYRNFCMAWDCENKTCKIYP